MVSIVTYKTSPFLSPLAWSHSVMSWRSVDKTRSKLQFRRNRWSEGFVIAQSYHVPTKFHAMGLLSDYSGWMVAATNISPLLQECFFSGNICFAQRKLFTFSRISLAVRERSATKQNKIKTERIGRAKQKSLALKITSERKHNMLDVY